MHMYCTLWWDFYSNHVVTVHYAFLFYYFYFNTIFDMGRWKTERQPPRAASIWITLNVFAPCSSCLGPSNETARVKKFRVSVCAACVGETFLFLLLYAICNNITRNKIETYRQLVGTHSYWCACVRVVLLACVYVVKIQISVKSWGTNAAASIICRSSLLANFRTCVVSNSRMKRKS